MDERGFTLVELLVGMTILVGVMMATFSVLDDSTRMASRDNERSSAIDEARVGVDRMVRELRHARQVTTATPQVLNVTVLRRGIDQQVEFNCSTTMPAPDNALRRCTRSVAGGPGEVLVDRIRTIGTSDTSAFTYTPSTGTPRHVAVRLAVAVDGGKKGGYRESLVLTDGTRLRNVP